MAPVSLQFIVWFTIIYWIYPTEGEDRKIVTGISILGHDAQHVVAQKNAKLLLNCSVSSQFGDPYIRWQKNGIPLNLAADNHIQKVQNGSLYFKKFYHKKKKNITDEGVYECLATNKKGTILARRVKLEVAGIARSFSLQPQDQTVVEGGVARFQCQIKASPPPLYFWLKEGVPLNADARHVLISTGILQILNVESGDAGTYQCTATPGKLHDLPDQVEHFKWKRSNTITLTVTPGKQNRPPTIVAGPQNTTVVEGQSAVLECLVDGSPKPTVTWMRRDGSNILRSGGVIFGDTNLKILEVKPMHSDSYYCNASVPGFPPVIARATLDVLTRPVIQRGPRSVTYPAAHSARFFCEVNGKPRPKLQWLKNGRDIRDSSDSSYKIRNYSELIITGTVSTDSGYYQCIAENVVDYTMKIARLEVYAEDNAPKPPTEVSAKANNSTSVLVAWNAAVSDSRPLIAYSLDIHEKENPSEKENFVVQGTTYRLIRGLKPYTNYSLFVRAYNNVGASQRSEVITVRTLEDVPTAAPLIRVRNTTPTSMEIEWKELPTQQRNGKITSYKIFVKKEDDTAIKMEESNNGSITSYIIQGLEPSTTYKVRVLAGTKIGYPRLSDDKWHWIQDTTPPFADPNMSVPTCPTLEVIPINLTSVNVTWVQDSLGIPVTTYTIFLKRLDSPSKERQFADVPPKPNYFVITELSNETHYQVSLIAENQNGASGPVVQEFVTEENPAPPAPRSLEADVDSNSIHLTWVQPTSPVVIEQYVIRYQPWMSQKDSAEEKILTSKKIGVLISDLKPYTYYHIDVRAQSRYSSSRYSHPILERTKEDRPSEPRNLQVAVRTDSGLVIIKWSPPARPNGNITTYIVMVSPDGDHSGWKSIKVNGSLTSAKIEDLHGGTYYVKIMACTKAGPGPSSEQIKVLAISQQPKQPDKKQQNPSTPLEDQKLGIILGVTIGVVCIIICILIIMLRHRCFNHAYPHTQPVHAPGNGHVMGYHANGHMLRLDRELHEMEPYTPMLTQYPENHHLDSKGCGSGNLIVTPNGSRVNGYVPFSNGLRNGHAHNGQVATFMSSASQPEIKMPRRRFWKKSLAKKQAVLQTDVTEDTSLDKNSIVVDLDMTEDTGLGKNSIRDLTNDVTEDTGLGKNSIRDCEDTALLKTVSKSNVEKLEQKFEQKLEHKLEHKLECKLESNLESKLESNLKSKLESKPENYFASKLENNLEKSNLCNLNATSFTNENSLDSADKDVIFENQTGPVIYPFQQLSFGTKLKLIKQLGIEANIKRIFNNDSVGLGKPENTRSILGDGNCFFRALSFAVSDEENHHLLFRKAVVNHMMRFQHKFTTHLRSGFKSVPEYLSSKRMIHGGTWATEVEILAAADLLKVDIYIYDEVSSWELFSAKQVDKCSKIEQNGIYLIHRHQAHYDVVLSVEKAVSINVENFNGNRHTSDEKYSVSSGIDHTEEYDLQDASELIPLINIEHGNKNRNIATQRGNMLCTDVSCGNLSFYEASKAEVTFQNEKEVVQGNFHQGHPTFLNNAGKQCVLNSLSALLYSREKTMNLWTALDLDHTLVKGDEMYGYIRNSSAVNYDYLSISDIPRLIEYNEKMYKIEFQESLSGTLGNVGDLDQYQFVTMYEALQVALDQHQIHGVFITFKGNTFVVVKQTGGYFVFDSHSRNRAGLQVSDGNSLLMYLKDIQQVYDHCINLAASMNYSPQDMFEVTAVHVVYWQVEFNEYDSSNVLSGQKHRNCLKENEECNVEEKEPLINNECQMQTLLDKYFQYQENMNKKKSAHKIQSDKKPDRKQYMRNYMKKRRESCKFKICDRKFSLKSKRKSRESRDFCEHECEAQRGARQNPEMKIKNKQSTLKTMTKARKSKDFCEHECEAKRAARQNPEMKMKNKQSTLKTMTKARKSKDFCEHECEAQRAARQNPEMKMKNKQSTLKTMTKARKSKDFCEHECEAQRAARQNPEMKMKNKQSTLKTMTKARKSKDFCEHECEAKRAARQNPDTKMKNKQSTLKTMTKARKSKDFCEHECEAQRAARQNPQMKIKNKQSTLKTMTKARKSKNFCEHEYEAQRAARKNPEVKNKNRQSTLKTMAKARKSKDFCEHEIEAKRIKRQHPLQLECERILKQESRKRHRMNEKQQDKITKAVKRRKVEFSKHEADLTMKRTYGITIDECIEKFHETAAKGPVFVCTCCHQTWFPRSVVKLSTTNISKQSKAYCTGFKSQEDEEWLCRTCLVSLKEDKIPKLSAHNGMKWPTKPEVLKLHPLEERLISQRIPFMQIRELPRGGQLSAKGNVVNVPVDIQPTVNALPRQIDEHVTIAVKLKKRLSHKSACFTENVRPNAVMKALDWLMKNSEMYQNAGITVNSAWKETILDSQNELTSELTGRSHTVDERETETPDDEFCEISTDEGIQGNSDTLVDEADTDTNKVYVFAPGENQKPLSLYDDKDAEYLCFPTIFCGQRRKPNSERTNPIHYSDIAKWELRSVDRRAANSVPNIFFKLKKIQTKQVSDKVNLALRRCKTEGKKLTAGQARDSSTTNEIVRLNEGYYIFRTLRNSPAYLSSKKKDVFAMIRQLGLPTWFISLSSADTRWTDLLRTLAQLDGKTLSNNDLKNADWSVKTNLVQKDPVTCARYFDNRVQLFINSFLKSPYNPIGAVTDTFRRVEFQNRGSPHIHMLVWTKDAPRYPDDDEKDIIEYVDKYVTCSLQTNNPELAELVELQMHKHSKTCKKRDKPVCRFGFPLPPLPNTMLLEPLETDVEKYKKKYSELQRKMNEYKDGCSLSFSDFLQNIVQMEEDEYIRCIRSSLKGPKIFLKRNPAEMRVNYYNPAVLKAWHANLDIQFVLDPYACATYIVSYISKSQRGISALLEKASQEATDGNMDLRRQVRHIGNKFLNFVEVSAQEASYLILQMPLTQATRDVVFINTSPPDERVFLLKSQEDLENLPENSTDIKAENMISRYAKRPKQLQNWCLADVVSELEVTFPEKCDQSEVQNDDDVIEEENFSDEDVVVHLKNGIKIRKRKNKRVIRYVSYSKKTNSEQYYRERIFLFLPWRNENTDIINGYTTFEQHYRSKANIIQSVQKKYEHFADELEQARLQAEYEVDDFDEVAPNTEHTEAEDADIGPQPSEQFVHFDPGTHGHKNYDIGPDIGLPQNQSEIQTSPVRMPEDQYHKLLQSLNCRQREFHNHVTHWIQNKDEPLYAFLTGGAGTGKSVVIDALYQTLHRTLCSEEGENPDDVRILLCAYTGKAAYNINGMTIASAFHKKMYQTQQNMYADELNTYRTKYRNLSVVIIDEISMVGNKLLAFIHERLQQLTGTKQDFGGISIIAVGDLYQLSPVGDAWIFKDLSCPGQGLAKNLWKEHFTMFELTEIMRQKDDMAFSKLLNRLRHNELSDQDRQTIMTRKIQQNSTNYPQTAPHLFIENKFVDNFNTSFMLNLTTNKVDVKADTDVLSQTKLSPDVKKSLIANLPDKHATTGQLKTNLTIAVNMIYDISVNLDVADGLTNGCTCVVKYIEYKHSALRPAIVWVLFDDEKVGAMRRHQYQHLLRSNIHKSWTPIFETKRTFTYNKKTFERIQFPLQPSAAKTIHKAQGATLNQVVVSLSQTKKRKIPHIHYVALSRVRSLENLHIIDFNEDGLSKDKDVDAEMKRLAENGLKLCYTPLYNVNMHGRFLFNNVRSLNKHISDIRSDPNLYAAELVGIAESRLWESDENYTFQLEGFNLYRNDAESLLTRPHHGLVTYVKSHLHVSTYEMFSTKEIEFSFLSFSLCQSLVQCAVVYKNPSCPLSHFYTVMEDQLLPLVNVNEKIVIIGDFNVDLMKTGHTFVSFMESKFHCSQIINQPTTKMNSQLDLIFTNFVNKKAGVLEAYWSDHKIVYAAVSF